MANTGTEKKPLVSSPGEGGASALLTLSSQDAEHLTLAGDSQQTAASQACAIMLLSRHLLAPTDREPEPFCRQRYDSL